MQPIARRRGSFTAHIEAMVLMAARKREPESVLDAAKSDDYRRTLVALRDGLATAFDTADPNLRPQISGQLRAVLADLATLPAEKKATPTDEIRARREARRQSTAASDAVAAGSGKQRRPRGA